MKVIENFAFRCAIWVGFLVLLGVFSVADAAGKKNSAGQTESCDGCCIVTTNGDGTLNCTTNGQCACWKTTSIPIPKNSLKKLKKNAIGTSNNTNGGAVVEPQ